MSFFRRNSTPPDQAPVQLLVSINTVTTFNDYSFKFMRCATWKYRDWFVNFCYCSVKSCLFAQCWPDIFLVQCWWNLYNVGVVFAAAGHYQKVNQSKINAQATIQWAFPVQCCLESLGQYCTGFYLCNVAPRVLRQHWTEFFHVECCLEPLGQHYTRYFSCKVLSQQH